VKNGNGEQETKIFFFFTEDPIGGKGGSKRNRGKKKLEGWDRKKREVVSFAGTGKQGGIN